MTRPEILIVEDEAVVRMDIEEKLKSMGYQVSGYATSGEGATRKVEQLNPDLVLMDIEIEGQLNGIEAANLIKSQFDIPVVFVTAHVDEKTIERVKDSQPFGYLPKPINENGLRATIEMALYKHKLDMEHRQAVAEKEKMREQLIQAQTTQAIANLAGGVAHNFNNALVGISGCIDLLEMELLDNETVKKFARPMRSSVRRMTNLTNQLLAYARGGKYQPKKLSLKPFIDAARSLLQYSIGTNVQIKTDLPGESLHIEADMTQMQMVLSAILTNSSEAMEDSGNIRIAMKKIELDGGGYACISIEDEGIGMDEETRSRVFEPFFSTKRRGRGLGMAAVYGIIQNHHGRISVDSTPGKGTAVNIYLPLASPGPKEPEEPEQGIVHGTGTVLLIEDEDTVINVTVKVLEKLGYRVLVAKNGGEAEKIVQTFPGDIDLAILDIALPDIPGNQVFPLLKTARPNLKVLVYSGYSIDGPAREILNAGAEEFIQKPFTLESLSRKVKTVLESG
jgi:two-component system cell cycle sensor histidine kinase/response regulator CckA